MNFAQELGLKKILIRMRDGRCERCWQREATTTKIRPPDYPEGDPMEVCDKCWLEIDRVVEMMRPIGINKFAK